MDKVALIGATVLSTVGTIVSANDQASAAKAAGKDAQRVGDWQAAQARQAAGQERASAQRQAIEERRAANLAVSRARALAAGSGGGANDPTVLKIYGDLSAEGEQNALTALWEGEERARTLETQGAAAQYEGAAQNSADQYMSSAYKRAGYLSGIGNLLAGGADFYSKYVPEKTAPAKTPKFIGGTGSTKLSFQY